LLCLLSLGSWYLRSETLHAVIHAGAVWSFTGRCAGGGGGVGGFTGRYVFGGFKHVALKEATVRIGTLRTVQIVALYQTLHSFGTNF
jgi:hypothetical protein